MSKSKSIIVMVLALAVLIWGPAVGAAADKKVVIKLSDQVNEQNPHFKAHEFFAKTVAEKSGGSIEVKIFPNSQLGSAREGLEGVLSGTIQAVKVTSGELSTYSPKFLVFSLPYMFTNKQEVFAALDGKLGDILTPELEKQGFKLVAFFDTGFRSVFNQKRPIMAVADMKGLKIRVINDPVMIETINTLGALATPLPYGELYTALQQKVVDGQENPLSNIYKAKFYEVQKYLSLTGHLHLTHMVMYSDKLWDKLPADLQKVVRESVVESQETQRKAVRDDDAKLLGALKEKGMQVNEADRAAFRESVLPLREEAVKEFGPKAKQWIELIESTK